MGQSKGGGYKRVPTLSRGQKFNISQLLQQSIPNQQQAAGGFQQFLPGGGGGQPIIDAANKNFQQQTIPSILNAFGTGSKESSSLNQALAAGGANLNTDLASLLSQLQLSASQGLGNLGMGQSNLGVGTPQFAYLQRQPPLWQQLVAPLLGAGSDLGSAAIKAAGSTAALV